MRVRQSDLVQTTILKQEAVCQSLKPYNCGPETLRGGLFGPRAWLV